MKSSSQAIISSSIAISLYLFILMGKSLARTMSRPIRLINMIPNTKSSPIPQISYQQGKNWQEMLVNSYIDQQRRLKHVEVQPSNVGSLLLLQHQPVYTLGSATQADSGPFGHRLSDGTYLDYEVIETERGGQATYHGPGQLVAYPILDLNYFRKDLHVYLRNLEESIIKTFDKCGIQAYTVSGRTGVWHNEEKLAAIGIKVSRWVTLHGLSINVDPDMRYFDNIVPCGISDKKAGCIRTYNSRLSMQEVSDHFIDSFNDVFETKIVEQHDDISSLKLFSSLATFAE
jgi:lipoyl(octanoyl) transferase